VLIEALSKKKPLLFRNFLNVYDRPVYMVVGSLLHTPRVKNAQVWGTGLISDAEVVVAKPRKIFAVRGPRTREMLLKQDISCPKVFGDPALLFPSIYCPDVMKEYRLGIIPHYMDTSSPLLSGYRNVEGVKIIDVASDVHEFVRDVCSCRAIASSSLHGCIAADAYHIPSLWIKITGNIRGKDFKFHDYYESIGHENVTPFSLASADDADELVDECQIKEINLDLAELRNACPFLAE
jgi:pyruvyltransferase